jgi:hypothetical protein
MSVPPRAVNKVEERHSRLTAPDVFGNHLRRGVGAGIGGNMGGDGDAGVGPERVVLRQGFDPEHIERGMADLAAVEGGEQGFIVDQRAATECGLLLADHWSAAARKGVTRTKFKFDWQIVAIALSRNVSQIYSDDGDLQRIAEPLPLTVTAIDSLPIPASALQTKLEFKS